MLCIGQSSTIIREIFVISEIRSLLMVVMLAGCGAGAGENAESGGATAECPQPELTWLPIIFLLSLMFVSFLTLVYAST